MHRITTLVSLMILICGPISVAQQPVVSPRVSEATPPSPTAHRPPGGRPSADPNQGHPMTNDEVVKLVKGGVPESVIVASIQSSPNNFDLSSGALIGLRKAGVNQKILEAMKAANGGDGGYATPFTGQPAARRSDVRKAGAGPALKFKLSPSKFGPKIENPHALQANAAILAVLQKQRQAADAEAAQMKLGIRPVGQNGLPAVQSESTSGFTDPNKSSVPAAQSQAKSSTSTNRATAAMPSTAQRPATPTMTGPGKTSDVSGNSPSSSLLHATQLPTTVLTCTNDPTMRILNVSGEFFPATFTPDAQYNFYTIAGCSFGDPGPNSKVCIYYQDTFHQRFQVQEWNDNGIKLNINPTLRGLLDHDNLTLVVQRADGKQATKGGFKFYAARETTRLASIPRSSFSLNPLTLNKTSDLSLLYTSPSLANVNPMVGGWTTEVLWTTSNPSADKMDSGEDIYQFKQLQPGFTADSAQMAAVNLDCGGDEFINLSGNFGLKWVGDDLHATWQAQYCKSINCGGAFQGDCFQEPPSSSYAVNVWATGPRGVDPWTGKPN